MSQKNFLLFIYSLLYFLIPFNLFRYVLKLALGTQKDTHSLSEAHTFDNGFQRSTVYYGMNQDKLLCFGFIYTKAVSNNRSLVLDFLFFEHQTKHPNKYE